MEEKSAIHALKTWPEYFEAVRDGRKRFELRVNDREFLTGDWLWLQEWNPDTRIYSGRELWMRVTYIAQGVFGLPENVCVMSIEPVNQPEHRPICRHCKRQLWRNDGPYFTTDGMFCPQNFRGSNQHEPEAE